MATFLFFFTFIEGMLCCDWKEHRKKKLANRISNQIWYKGCLKGKSGEGVQICEGVQIRCDTGKQKAVDG